MPSLDSELGNIPSENDRSRILQDVFDHARNQMAGAEWTRTVPDDFVMPEKNRWDKIKDLETAVERLFVGAFSIEGNELNVRATIWNDNSTWQYHIHITYELNGKDRDIRLDVNVHEVNHPRDIVMGVREAVLIDLANLITQDFADKNQKTLINAAKSAFS